MWAATQSIHMEAMWKKTQSDFESSKVSELFFFQHSKRSNLKRYEMTRTRHTKYKSAFKVLK